MAMVLMPPAYKNEAGVHVISPRHQIPDPLELLTIMTVMAVSGDLASIRKDFIILTILTVRGYILHALVFRGLPALGPFLYPGLPALGPFLDQGLSPRYNK